MKVEIHISISDIRAILEDQEFLRLPKIGRVTASKYLSKFRRIPRQLFEDTYAVSLSRPRLFDSCLLGWRTGILAGREDEWDFYGITSSRNACKLIWWPVENSFDLISRSRCSSSSSWSLSSGPGEFQASNHALGRYRSRRARCIVEKSVRSLPLKWLIEPSSFLVPILAEETFAPWTTEIRSTLWKNPASFDTICNFQIVDGLILINTAWYRRMSRTSLVLLSDTLSAN